MPPKEQILCTACTTGTCSWKVNSNMKLHSPCRRSFHPIRLFIRIRRQVIRLIRKRLITVQRCDELLHAVESPLPDPGRYPR